MSAGLDQAPREKMLSDRQEHVREWIRGNTSYPELQQISTVPKSQRFPLGVSFPPALPLSLVSRSSST